MGRRSVVKVDYSKFDAETANSDEDDDFQHGTPPKKGKTKKSKDNQLQVKKPEVTVSKESKESKRKTRTSNADLLYQQDIITAIKASETKDVIVKVNKSATKNVKKKKYSLISDDEEDSHIPDTLPVVDNLNNLNEDEDEKDEILTTSGSLIVSNLKENIESDEEIDTMSSTKKHANRTSKHVEGKGSKVNQSKSNETYKGSKVNQSKSNETYKGSKVNQSKSNETCKEKILIPGRLRIGLSRNLRVTKPLHPGVCPKV